MGYDSISWMRSLAYEMKQERLKEELRLFGRIYLPDERSVSDRVKLPEEAEAYQKAGEDLVGITVQLDPTGELSRREAPPEGHIFAIVREAWHSEEQGDIFWARVSDLIPDFGTEATDG